MNDQNPHQPVGDHGTSYNAPSGYPPPYVPPLDERNAIQQNYAPQAPANPERNGLGLAAVILGPIGIMFAIIPLTGFIAVVLGIVGLALGLAGYSRVRKNKATNGKTAITGIILSLLALVIGIIGIVIVFNATAELGNDLDCISNADTSAEIDAC